MYFLSGSTILKKEADGSLIRYTAVNRANLSDHQSKELVKKLNQEHVDTIGSLIYIFDHGTIETFLDDPIGREIADNLPEQTNPIGQNRTEERQLQYYHDTIVQTYNRLYCLYYTLQDIPPHYLYL